MQTIDKNQFNSIFKLLDKIENRTLKLEQSHFKELTLKDIHNTKKNVRCLKEVYFLSKKEGEK